MSVEEMFNKYGRSQHFFFVTYLMAFSRINE